MNSTTKTRILRIAIAVSAFAFMIIPFFQVKIFLGVVLGILLFFTARRMRAVKREKDVIILSEDEVRYTTREKEEPASKSEAASKTASEAASKTASEAASETRVKQEDVREEAAGAKEKVKTSAYTL